MIIPTYLRGDEQQDYNEQLNQSLERSLSENGFIIPSLTTAQITSVEPNMPKGTLWFNSTLAKLQVKTASGVVETITSV